MPSLSIPFLRRGVREKTPDFPSWWSTTPEGKKFAQEHEDKIRSECEATIARIIGQEQTLTAKLDAADKKLKELKEVERRHREEYIGVYSAYIATRSEAAALANSLDRARQKAARDIEPFAPEAIKELRRELEAEEISTQRDRPQMIRGPQTRGGNFDGVAVNHEALGRRMAAINTAINSGLPQLLLTPEKDLQKAIQKLRDSIPECRDVWDDPKEAARIQESLKVAARERGFAEQYHQDRVARGASK